MLKGRLHRLIKVCHLVLSCLTFVHCTLNSSISCPSAPTALRNSIIVKALLATSAIQSDPVVLGKMTVSPSLRCWQEGRNHDWDPRSPPRIADGSGCPVDLHETPSMQSHISLIPCTYLSQQRCTTQIISTICYHTWTNYFLFIYWYFNSIFYHTILYTKDYLSTKFLSHTLLICFSIYFSFQHLWQERYPTWKSN